MYSWSEQTSGIRVGDVPSWMKSFTRAASGKHKEKKFVSVNDILTVNSLYDLYYTLKCGKRIPEKTRWQCTQSICMRGGWNFHVYFIFKNNELYVFGFGQPFSMCSDIK